MVNNTFLQHFYLLTRYCGAAMHWTEEKPWFWWKKSPSFSSVNSPKQSTSRQDHEQPNTQSGGWKRKQQAQRTSTPCCRNSPFQGQVKPLTRLTSSKAEELQVPKPCLQHYHYKTTYRQWNFTRPKLKYYFTLKCSLRKKFESIYNTGSYTEVSGTFPVALICVLDWHITVLLS